MRLLLKHHNKNRHGLYYCFWTILNWVNHDSLSSYRRLLINGFFIDLYPSHYARRKKGIVTIYTFKCAHQFTAIVLIKGPLFEIVSWCCRHHHYHHHRRCIRHHLLSFCIILPRSKWRNAILPFVIVFVSKWEKCTFSIKMNCERIKLEFKSVP